MAFGFSIKNNSGEIQFDAVTSSLYKVQVYGQVTLLNGTVAPGSQGGYRFLTHVALASPVPKGSSYLALEIESNKFIGKAVFTEDSDNPDPSFWHGIAIMHASNNTSSTIRFLVLQDLPFHTVQPGDFGLEVYDDTGKMQLSSNEGYFRLFEVSQFVNTDPAHNSIRSNNLTTDSTFIMSPHFHSHEVVNQRGGGFLGFSAAETDMTMYRIVIGTPNTLEQTMEEVATALDSPGGASSAGFVSNNRPPGAINIYIGKVTGNLPPLVIYTGTANGA